MHSGITALLITLLLAMPWPGQAKTFKIATISPDGLSWIKRFRGGISHIAEATEGRVKFKIYPGGVQGDGTTVLRKMRIGQLHGGALSAGALVRFNPDLQVYNMPLQWRSLAEVDHVRGKVDESLTRGLEGGGIVAFAFSETGFAYLLSRAPVRSLAELKTLKVWIPEGNTIAEKLTEAIAVSPIPLNITDVLAGLQTGLIDAVVAPPVVALALQWHNHVDYVLDLPLVYIYSMLAMDKKAFDSITPPDQKIVRQTMNRVFKEIGVATRIDNEEAFAALLSVGVEIVKPEGMSEWQSVADRFVAQLVESGKISPAAVQLYLQALEEFREQQE